MSEDLQKDEFILKLEEKTKWLKSCQKEKMLNSCFPCDKLFECDIRKNYVDAAYDSMSKGSGGGFEF